VGVEGSSTLLVRRKKGLGSLFEFFQIADVVGRGKEKKKKKNAETSGKNSEHHLRRSEFPKTNLPREKKRGIFDPEREGGLAGREVCGKVKTFSFNTLDFEKKRGGGKGRAQSGNVSSCSKAIFSNHFN